MHLAQPFLGWILLVGGEQEPGTARVVLQAVLGVGQFLAHLAKLAGEPFGGTLRHLPARFDILLDVLLGERIDEIGGIPRIGAVVQHVHDPGLPRLFHIQVLPRALHQRVAIGRPRLRRFCETAQEELHCVGGRNRLRRQLIQHAANQGGAGDDPQLGLNIG